MLDLRFGILEGGIAVETMAKTPTLEEAVAVLLDCGFASEEQGPPSFDDELALGHPPERRHAVGTADSSQNDSVCAEDRPAGSVSSAGEMQMDEMQLAGFAARGLEPRPTHAASVQVRLKPRRRRTAKDELEKLRRHVASLTLRRDALRRGLAEERSQEGEDASGQDAALWEQVAGMQRSQRQRSETENGQLRRMLQTQRRKAQYFRRVLSSSSASDARSLEQIFGLETLGSSLAAVPGDNDAVYEELRSKLDDMYLEVAPDALSASFPADWSSVQASSGVVFTHRERKRVPFERRVVELAVWDSMGKRGVEDGKNYCVCSEDVAGDTRTSSWRAAYSRSRLQIDVLIRRVARKFVVEDCTIVVCRILMQPTSFGAVSLSGLQYWESRFVVIQRGPQSQLGATTTVSCYLDVARGNTQASTPQHTQPRRAASFSDYEAVAWRSVVAARAQTLENLLLERARGSQLPATSSKETRERQ
jgi:hypothetical protein